MWGRHWKGIRKASERTGKFASGRHRKASGRHREGIGKASGIGNASGRSEDPYQQSRTKCRPYPFFQDHSKKIAKCARSEKQLP